MVNNPFCSIVIPALNEEQDIEQGLKSLNNQTYPRDCYEIIVVDNGSTDRTKEIAAKYADKVIEKIGVNVGAVRNYGADHSRGEILICTDADCLVDNDWIQNGVTLLINNPKHVFGGGLKPRANSTWIERNWLLNDDGMTIQQQDLMGSCIFCWKDDFNKIGQFNTEITSGEDSDLSSRFKKQGYVVKLTGHLSLVHSGSPQNITTFVKRQMWHSENYLGNIKKSISDKVFWITVCYLATFSLLIFYLATGTFDVMILSVNQVLPLILSIKRLRRSSQSLTKATLLIKTLFLDNLYLIGRSIGLLIGVRMILSS